MSRIKRGVMTRKRHKKLLKQTKGYWGQRANVFKRAKETLLRALEFAFIGRRNKKRDFRGLFIVRINAACRANDLSYSRFIAGLKKADVVLNRKVLSQLAVYEPAIFAQLVEKAKQANA